MLLWFIFSISHAAAVVPAVLVWQELQAKVPTVASGMWLVGLARAFSDTYEPPWHVEHAVAATTVWFIDRVRNPPVVVTVWQLSH
jgi:hypothetical protein